MDGDPQRQRSGTSGEVAPPPPLPSLPARAIGVMVSPGKITAALAREPRWFAAFLLGMVVVSLSVWLIPVEVYRESFRAVALETGRPIPDQVAEMSRTFGPIGVSLWWLIFTMLLASVATVTFAFIFGDEGTFKQYLSVTSHALLIPALGGLITVPLRIMAKDIRMTLSVGSLMAGFLSPGYLLNLLRGLDFFLLLALAVVAVGAGQIDRRRTWGSAFATLLLFSLLLSAVFAFFQ